MAGSTGARRTGTKKAASAAKTKTKAKGEGQAKELTDEERADQYGELPVFDAEEFDRWVADSHWTFAKSMPGIPHFYTVADWPTDEEGRQRCLAAAVFIRDNGVRAQWPKEGRGKYVNAYWEADDAEGQRWSYWVLWPVINRAQHPLVPQNEVKVLDEADTRQVKTWMPRGV